MSTKEPQNNFQSYLSSVGSIYKDSNTLTAFFAVDCALAGLTPVAMRPSVWVKSPSALGGCMQIGMVNAVAMRDLDLATSAGACKA